MTHRALILAATASLLMAGAAGAQAVSPAPEPMPEAATPPIDGAAAPTGEPSTDSPTTSGATVPSSSAPSAATGMGAPSAMGQGSDVSATMATVTPTTLSNQPIPDTRENRAKYGQPNSNAGKRSAAKGN